MMSKPIRTTNLTEFRAMLAAYAEVTPDRGASPYNTGYDTGWANASRDILRDFDRAVLPEGYVAVPVAEIAEWTQRCREHGQPHYVLVKVSDWLESMLPTEIDR